MHCPDCCSPPPLFNSTAIRAPVPDKGKSTELQSLNARPPGETASALARLCLCSGVFFLTGPASPGTAFTYSLDDRGWVSEDSSRGIFIQPMRSHSDVNQSAQNLRGFM